MSACPRCGGVLALREQGVLRDEHGVFLPASTLRRAYAVDAALRSALAASTPTGPPCPSCRSALHEARVSQLSLEGCPSCGGWWLDRGELDRLREAMLSRAQEKPKSVGGYGGTATTRSLHAWGPSAEALFALLNGLGGFS